MATYRWGRFRKNVSQRIITGEKIESLIVADIKVSNTFGGGGYLELYNIKGTLYRSFEDNGRYGRGVGRMSIQSEVENMTSWDQLNQKLNKCFFQSDAYYFGRDHLIAVTNLKFRYKKTGSGLADECAVDGYEILRVEENPFKGSRIDTVTSTNRNAYPNNGESGSYWYVYEGIANQTPTISGQDEDWGGYKQAFKRYYSVDDGDSGQQLNVTVTLNGVTIATVNNATRKTDYPIDIDDSKFNALTLNEQNTIEITVTDSSGATAVRRYTFKRINTAPVVTMTNAHYGEQNKPFTVNFEAADPDGDEITAKLFIDDVQIKDLGTIKGKQSVTIPKIDFAKIPNGEHKIRVEAKDSYNAVGAGYADFSKNLTYAWYRLKKELSEQPSAVIVNPLAELAPGAKMTIKVCSNVMDAQPTWEIVPEELYGQKYNFRNTTKTGDKWGVGVEIRIDKEKATEESYLYGFVGAYM